MGQERRNQSQREIRVCNSPCQTSSTFTNSNPSVISTSSKYLLSVKAGCTKQLLPNQEPNPALFSKGMMALERPLWKIQPMGLFINYSRGL